MWKLWGYYDQQHIQGHLKLNTVIKENIQSKEVLINSEEKNDNENRIKTKDRE